MADERFDQMAGIGALAEPARRALYQFVIEQPEAVSREQAAEAVGVPVHSAKFHLEKLVEQGLLDVEFRRLSGRTGPGAGRPSKLYLRSHRQFSVSLPERRYDIAGSVLAAAIDASIQQGVPVIDAVRQEALRQGRRIPGETEEPAVGGADLERVACVLAEHGYEPRLEKGEIRLANCPFHRLASEHTELVCGMNLGLIDGVLGELAAHGLTPELAPEDGFCCVRIRAADAAAHTTRGS